MSIRARITLRPSGRTFETDIPTHPHDRREMIIYDGTTPISIRITAWGDSPAESARGPLLVEANEL